MKVQNKNASSVKTKTLIRKIFAEMLMEKQELKKISVSELVKRADINRTTFYAHYSDIFGISEEMENETVSELFGKTALLDTTEKMEQFLRETFLYFRGHEDIYRMLLSSDDPLRFLRKLRKIVKDKLLQGVRANDRIAKKPYIELQLVMYVDGLAEQFIEYFRDQSNLTLDKLCDGLIAVFETIIS